MKKQGVQLAEHEILSSAKKLDLLRVAEILLTPGCYDEALFSLWRAERARRRACEGQ